MHLEGEAVCWLRIGGGGRCYEIYLGCGKMTSHQDVGGHNSQKQVQDSGYKGNSEYTLFFIRIYFIRISRLKNAKN